MLYARIGMIGTLRCATDEDVLFLVRTKMLKSDHAGHIPSILVY